MVDTSIESTVRIQTSSCCLNNALCGSFGFPVWGPASHSAICVPFVIITAHEMDREAQFACGYSQTRSLLAFNSRVYEHQQQNIECALFFLRHCP